mgnify:CR=1 FL=1
MWYLEFEPGALDWNPPNKGNKNIHVFFSFGAPLLSLLWCKLAPLIYVSFPSVFDEKAIEGTA